MDWVYGRGWHDGESVAELLDAVDQVLVQLVAALEAGEPARVRAQPRVHLLQRPFVQHALR